MLKRTLCAAFCGCRSCRFFRPGLCRFPSQDACPRHCGKALIPPKKTFVVKDRDGKAIPFRVDDRSEFELEHRDKPDQDVPFTELKTGDRVKVKAFKGRTAAPRG